MNTIFKYVLIVCLAGISNLAFGQNGTLRGTVIEEASGDPLYGVTVLVEGTSKGTTTDFDGKFELRLQPGTYNLKISYISYKHVRIEGVEITPGEINVLGTISLESTIEELDEVVVTAESIYISEAALITQKKRSPNLIDGISAEAFRRSGVSDAGEALKKVTGVSVQDGKYVYVRGLGDRYSNTMLNTVEIPSLDPTRNSLQIDIFPTNLIDNMVISKTAVADMPADFTGGIVNLVTKDFPDRPIFDLSLSMGYNPSMHFNDAFLTYNGSKTDFLGFDNGLRELPDGAAEENIPTPINGASGQEIYNFVKSFNPTLGPKNKTNLMDYSMGFTLGNQFNLKRQNKLGYIFTLNYKNSNNYYDNFRIGEYQNPEGATNYDLIYATRQNGTVSEQNVLIGGLAGLAFKTPKSKYKLTGMRLQNGSKRSANFFIDDNGSAPGQSGYIGDSYNLEYGQRSVSNLLLNGTHYFDKTRWEVDWRLSPTFSKMSDPDVRRTTYTLSETGGEPTFNAGAGGFPSRLWRDMDEINLVGRLNVTREYELFGEVAKLKFGGSHVYKERDYEILTFNMAFFGDIPDLTGDPSEILVEDNIYDGPGGNDGTIYYQSGNPDPNPNAYNSNVHKTSVYLSNEFGIGSDLKTTLGLRAENYVQRHTGRDARFAQGDSNGNNLDNGKVLDALDLFPSANVTYFLNDDMNLRFAYSRTIARPSFRELSFAQILDPISDRIFNGGLFPIGSWDGNLRETRIQNFDLRWEKFFRRDELLSLSFFYKTFDDPIELVRIRTQITSNENQPRNVGYGEVFGAEFELRKSFDFISSSFSKFAFNTNLTLVKSRIEMTEEEFQARLSRQKEGQQIDDRREMAGQAPFIVNAGLTYDNAKIGLDAGLFYNVKGETLVLVGGGTFPDVYSDPFHSLNFNMNKKFGKATLDLNVSNILGDSREEFYKAYRAEDQIYEKYNPHRSISVGIKYAF